MKLNASGKQTFGSGIAFIVVASSAVVLRFYARTLTKVKWAMDDWTILLTLFAFYGYMAAEFWGAVKY